MLELFLKLDTYFYLEPRSDRIEGSMVGLMLRDLSKLYSFCSDNIKYIQEKIFKVEDRYALCLNDQYVNFLRFTKSIKNTLNK